MFDNMNPYSFRIELLDGVEHYYVSFTDGQGVLQETEVTLPVFLSLHSFFRYERNLRRSDERHLEQSDLTEASLYSRAVHRGESLDEIVCNKEKEELLWRAIIELPGTQRRRFILYYLYDLTYAQIAEIESCSHVAVIHSISRAKTTIKAKINFFE